MYVIDAGRAGQKVLSLEYGKPGVIKIVLDGHTKAAIHQINPDSLKEEYSTIEVLRALQRALFG